jgi:drug/metabolite transporter (DMT)-like permease
MRHWYGFSLSLLVAFLWGVLPVFIKLSLQSMDAVTISCYRFAVAGLFVFILLWRKRSLSVMRKLVLQKKLWLLVATLFLVANYVSKVKGLEYLSPGSHSNYHAACTIFVDDGWHSVLCRALYCH